MISSMQDRQYPVRQLPVSIRIAGPLLTRAIHDYFAKSLDKLRRAA
jgi:hypothetical protein